MKDENTYIKKGTNEQVRAIRFTGVKPWPYGIIMEPLGRKKYGGELVRFSLPINKQYVQINVGEYIVTDSSGTLSIISNPVFKDQYKLESLEL